MATTIEMAVVIETVVAIRMIAAIKKRVFTADIAKASCKRLEKWFSSFILFKTASSYFTEANTIYNMFTLSAFANKNLLLAYNTSPIPSYAHISLAPGNPGRLFLFSTNVSR